MPLNKNQTAILVAVIGLLSGIVTALVGNWEKLFPGQARERRERITAEWSQEEFERRALNLVRLTDVESQAKRAIAEIDSIPAPDDSFRRWQKATILTEEETSRVVASVLTQVLDRDDVLFLEEWVKTKDGARIWRKAPLLMGYAVPYLQRSQQEKRDRLRPASTGLTR